MLADWLRPPAAAVTIPQDVLWTNVRFWLYVVLTKKKKASLTASSFSLPIQLTFHTPLLKIVPNQAPPPTHPQDFALAFVSASSSSTLINALMRNCNSILCQGEMEIERQQHRAAEPSLLQSFLSAFCFFRFFFFSFDSISRCSNTSGSTEWSRCRKTMGQIKEG